MSEEKRRRSDERRWKLNAGLLENNNQFHRTNVFSFTLKTFPCPYGRWKVTAPGFPTSVWTWKRQDKGVVLDVWILEV